MGMECNVPTTNSPACPATVTLGKPGISLYGMVMEMCGSRAEERVDSPDPQMIPMDGGDNILLVFNFVRMYEAARR